jgi:hypothetical protein
MITHTHYDVFTHESELLFTHRLKLGFIHPPRLPGDVNRIFRSRTRRHRCTPDCFTDLFTRFVTVSTASTPILPLRMPPPRQISCFETHVDPPAEVGFLDTPSSLGRKGAQSGKAALHPADRQPCGYKPIHQRGAIACPWYQSLRNRVGYFGGTGEILGLGFGSFFLCLVVFLFFFFVFFFYV